MLRLRRLSVRSFAFGVLVLAFSIQLAWAQTVGTAPSARALITQSVDEGHLAALRGNTRPEATPQNDRGAVADGFPMVHVLLQLRRSPEQESALQRFLGEVQDPASPNFHKWLTPEQFGQDFGVAQQDVDAIERWLQSHGFTVNLVYPNRMMIDFSGTAGQLREAFHTEIHNLEVNGERHIANMHDPQIPSALAPAIVGIVSLHDFKPRTQHEMRTAGANYTFNSGGSNYALVPADLATIYNLNPLFSAGYSGQGQTIVVIEDTNVSSTSDWSTFRSTFGLSGYSGSFSTSHPAPLSGPNNCADPGVTPDDIEAILDAEWASAAAPSATILLASCANTNTTFGGLIALQNLINASSQPPALVSISYGECETQNGASANAAYYAAYQQAVAEGISVFVSAGDSGAAGCDNNFTDATDGIGVSAFASTPYNVAVGGTDFSDTYSGTNNIYWNSTNTSNFGSALSYIPEIPWNDSCASVLLSTFVTGSGTTYGRNGFCNSASGGNFLTTAAGSGGPSACATGSPSVIGVVGGTCRGWPKPSWQSALSNFGNPNDGVRDTPDISLFAANGLWSHYYIFCFSDTANGGAPCTGAPSSWAGAGGTSFASPIMAGIQALVNQKTGQRQGNPNPVYYQLAATEYNQSSASCNSANGNGVSSTCIFYDITQGDMDVNCRGSNNCYRPSGTEGVLSTVDNSYSPAYGTTTGWDFATGIGSVNAANLVNNWPKSGLSGTPTVWIDVPAPGATVSGIVAISGWAVDNAAAVGTAISRVQVKVDGTIMGTASYGLNRPDVCAAYPGRSGCPNVGYSFYLNTSTLNVGSHTITVTATDSDATPDSSSASVTVNVQATPPTVWIDAPAARSTVSGTVTVVGWAIDNSSAVGTAISSVQVKVDGTVVGTATYGLSRPDVCAAFPGRPGCPNVGYSFSLNASSLSAGSHTITVTATDSDTAPDSGSASVTVTVQATPPTVWIDAPAAGSIVSGTVTVVGWAIDNTSAVGTAISSVQVKVDGTVAGTANYGLSRPDVCAVYPGRPGCPNVGYSFSLNTSSLSAGSHTITVTATDSDGTPDSGSASVTVTK